jgi:hypothetical protein
MDYFKIYPRSIYLYLDQPGTLMGKLHYELEQYGCFYKSRSCPVRLVQDDSPDGTWALVAEEFEAGNSAFAGFMEALNYYMAEVLGVDPFAELERNQKVSIDVHFHDVLFDVESRRIVQAPESLGNAPLVA